MSNGKIKKVQFIVKILKQRCAIDCFGQKNLLQTFAQF